MRYYQYIPNPTRSAMRRGGTQLYITCIYISIYMYVCVRIYIYILLYIYILYCAERVHISCSTERYYRNVYLFFWFSTDIVRVIREEKNTRRDHYNNDDNIMTNNWWKSRAWIPDGDDDHIRPGYGYNIICTCARSCRRFVFVFVLENSVPPTTRLLGNDYGSHDIVMIRILRKPHSRRRSRR